MGLSSKNKVDPTFNMSSMTDMVFLLLIFFMLTSNFATPSGLPINVPTSKASQKVIPKVTISIGPDLKYYYNGSEVSLEIIDLDLGATFNDGEGVVVLSVDKDVPVQYLVNVASIAAKHKLKVAISTKPE